MSTKTTKTTDVQIVKLVRHGLRRLGQEGGGASKGCQYDIIMMVSKKVWLWHNEWFLSVPATHPHLA